MRAWRYLAAVSAGSWAMLDLFPLIHVTLDVPRADLQSISTLTYLKVTRPWIDSYQRNIRLSRN